MCKEDHLRLTINISYRIGIDAIIEDDKIIPANLGDNGVIY